MSNPILKSALAALRADYTVTVGNVGAVVPETVLAPWLLARTADCSSPESNEEEGRAFLTNVFMSFECAMRNDLDVADDADASDIAKAIEHFSDDGYVHEHSDSAVPVYTHRKWLTFVQLAAYEEDVSDYVAEIRRLTGEEVANAALYIIADRLFRSLATELEKKML